MPISTYSSVRSPVECELYSHKISQYIIHLICHRNFLKFSLFTKIILHSTRISTATFCKVHFVERQPFTKYANVHYSLEPLFKIYVFCQVLYVLFNSIPFANVILFKYNYSFSRRLCQVHGTPFPCTRYLVNSYYVYSFIETSCQLLIHWNFLQVFIQKNFLFSYSKYVP